jgi:hypothetical protein
VGIAPMQFDVPVNGVTAEQSRQVRDWLLAILRFALTLDPADRAAVMTKAGDMDRLGSGKSLSQFTYFVRTSVEFCNRIVDQCVIDKAEVLRGHLHKIDDDRLRRSLEAALTWTKQVQRRDRCRDNLWKGLAAR